MVPGDPSNNPIGQRVAVVGCCGSGKSTLARRIAEAKGVPYVCSDALFFCDANWTERPRPEYYQLLEQHLSTDAFAFDGNIGGSQRVVLPRIDTLIWLDYPKPLVMRRLLLRTIRRAWNKEPLYAGSTESWRMSFASKDSILLFAWRHHHEYQRRYETLWQTIDPSITKYRVQSQRELDALLAGACV